MVGGTAGCKRRPHEYEAGIKGCITICHTCKCDGKTDTHELVDISGFNSKNYTFYLAVNLALHYSVSNLELKDQLDCFLLKSAILARHIKTVLL